MIRDARLAESLLFVCLMARAWGGGDEQVQAIKGTAEGVLREVLSPEDGVSLARVLLCRGNSNLGQVRTC